MDKQRKRSRILQDLLILVLAAVLLAACVSLFILKRNGRYDDE